MVILFVAALMLLPQGVVLDSASYQCGTSTCVNVTAYANPGYRFDHWVGVCPNSGYPNCGAYSGTSNPAVVAMSGPVNETAYFVPGTCASYCNSGQPTPVELAAIAVVGVTATVVGLVVSKKKGYL